MRANRARATRSRVRRVPRRPETLSAYPPTYTPPPAPHRRYSSHEKKGIPYGRRAVAVDALFPLDVRNRAETTNRRKLP